MRSCAHRTFMKLYHYQDMVSKVLLPGHGGRLQKEPSCWKAKEEKRAEGDFQNSLLRLRKL